MSIANYFPVFSKLTPDQQKMVLDYTAVKTVPAGTVVHNGAMECTGFLLVRSGQLRAYTLSEEGREVTVYRLFDHDCCLFSAACIMSSLQFEVIIETEKDSEIFIIPPSVYQKLMNESLPVSKYTNDLMASRFSDIMWLMDQIMWKSFDKRLAGFLLEETAIEGTPMLKVTHERIANHMGTAREVVTRMLRYFQSEGLVKLTRGTVDIINEKQLRKLSS